MAVNVDFKRIDDAVKKAGLSVNEAAALFHVSRPTLYNWRSGRGTNNAFVLNTIMRIVGLLETAVDRGELPLGKDVEFKNRLPQIQKILLGQKTQTSS